MSTRSTARTIDDYIAEFPPATSRCSARCAPIAAEAPDGTETISYAIPTFDLNGRHLVHFAGYAHHIGLYPMASGTAAFAEKLKPYKSGKGSVQFPLSKPLPLEPIRRIVAFRVSEVAGLKVMPSSARVSRP